MEARGVPCGEETGCAGCCEGLGYCQTDAAGATGYERSFTEEWGGGGEGEHGVGALAMIAAAGNSEYGEPEVLVSW